MIENLNGIYETVSYNQNMHLLLYDNVEKENYPDHWHRAVEIIMPIENSYTVSIHDKTYLLRPYDLLIVSPGVMHSIKAPSKGRRLIFQADISLLRSIQGLNSILAFIYPAALFTPENASGIHDQLCNLMDHIYKEYFQTSGTSISSSPVHAEDEQLSQTSDQRFGELSIYSDLLRMITLIGRAHMEKTERELPNWSKQQEYVHKFMKVCEYVDVHFQEEITLDQVAEMIGFSKYHFSRLFHDFTNMPFYRYLNRCRISHAEQLLSDPTISITEVAIQSGFSSQSAFLRMFKSFNNCTPSEFRKMQRQF